MTYVTLNDRTLGIYFDSEISRQVNMKVITLCREIEKLNLEGIKAIQHTYHMLAIHYDPNQIAEAELKKRVSEISLDFVLKTSQADVIRIPVCYDGPDLERVALCHGMSIDEVVHIHSSTKYYVYFLGFSAGFPYLGGLDQRIATPRLQTPRIKVKSGSVGIADQQTGIYTVDSPGGWNIIGRTPYQMFDSNKETPCLLYAGCYVKFYPVDAQTFNLLKVGDALD